MNARTLLLSLLGAAVLAAAVAGALRWQAGAAASDYPRDLRAHRERSDAIYRGDPRITAAAARLAQLEAALPPRVGQVEKAAEVGPPSGRLYAANTEILRREIADLPRLRSVPLAAALSPAWRRMRAKERALRRLYEQALATSSAAAEFYPAFGAAYDRLTRVIVFAPLLAQTAKASSDLRKLRTEAYGGSPAKDTRAKIRERLTNDQVFRRVMVATPMPSSYARRKQAVLDVIDARAAAGRDADAAIRAQDERAFKAAARIFDANDEARYVREYLVLCRELIALSDRFTEIAGRAAAVSASITG